jgi:hypothetical protein
MQIASSLSLFFPGKAIILGPILGPWYIIGPNIVLPKDSGF